MFNIEIECSNDAFNDWRSEISDMLTELAQLIATSKRNSGTLRDSNGNSVGAWEYNSSVWLGEPSQAS